MKLSKYEAREYRKKKMEHQLKGEGLYIFRNASKADLYLPKPAANNVKSVPPGGEFQGDSYFMELVRTNQARLVRTLITPEESRKMKMEEKLIVDQPDMVTTKGKVEHVVVTPQAKPLNEVEKKCESTKPSEVLINEDPMDGVDILG